MKDYYLYFLTNWTNSTLYVGVSNDLERRLHEHKSQKIPGFSKKYNLKKLVYYEVYPDPRAAIAREKQIKRWRRDKKDGLVEVVNSEWRDLSDDWDRRSLGFARDDRGGACRDDKKGAI